MSEPKLIEAEVIASGVSYFTSAPLLGPDGSIRKDRLGNDLYSVTRHEALMGDKIKLTPHEFDRLTDYVQKPGTAPLPRDSELQPTPFSVPLAGKTGWQGPVMGDPNPVGGLADNELHRRNESLTPEEAQELEAEAAERGGASDGEDAVLVWDDDYTADDVKAFVDANKLNVDDTVALADSPGHAELVLEAELARDNPRAGVVTPLEKKIGE